MAFTHEWGNEGVYINYTDNLSSDDLIKSNSLMIGNPEFEVIKYIMVDFNNVTNVELDDSDVKISVSFAEKSDPYNKHVKVAVISTNKHLKPLIEKYFENTLSILPHAQQKLFSNINEAKIWVAA